MNKLVAVLIIVLAIGLSACTKNQQASAPAQVPAVAEQSMSPAANEQAAGQEAAPVEQVSAEQVSAEQVAVEQVNSPVESGSKND